MVERVATPLPLAVLLPLCLPLPTPTPISPARLPQEARTLVAHCTLSICTLGAGDQPLQLATAEARVEVDARGRRMSQTLHKPRLCECVIFEEQANHQPSP